MNTTTPAPDAPSDALLPEDFDAIEDILDDLRTRSDETPQWEFCEGFLAALVCSRRAIPMPEALAVLFDIGEDGEGSFADAAQEEAFMALWNRRVTEVRTALDAPIDNLQDEGAFMPEVTDVRGMMADLSPEEREDAMRDQVGPLPAFAQVWALGFMFAVETWPEEWIPPAKDKEAVKVLNDALDAIVALSEDDTDPPEISPYEIDAANEGLEPPAPSMSLARMKAFGEALWAVYDLREMWRAIGPRVETVRVQPTPGRNDPCPCGSGKKYKKCHGA
ncbi:MAG: zinc chelation protein SecC [Rhodoferax sp.]|nr:zinc chelation protein SecC [Rhodoferax sp.]